MGLNIQLKLLNKSLINQIKTTSYFWFKHLFKLRVRLSSIGVEKLD